MLFFLATRAYVMGSSKVPCLNLCAAFKTVHGSVFEGPEREGPEREGPEREGPAFPACPVGSLTDIFLSPFMTKWPPRGPRQIVRPFESLCPVFVLLVFVIGMYMYLHDIK